MTDADRPMEIRRILVALDASRPSLAALEAAASLAARLEAELLGLFVEDINLLRLAGLPFAREASAVAGLARHLGAEEMERALRAQARRAEHALAQAAARRSLRWSFRVARGRVVEQLLLAATEADLIALGSLSRVIAPRGAAGAIALAVVAGAPRPILLLPQAGEIRPPISVIHDGTPAGRRAVALAARLLPESDEPVTVLLTEGDTDEGRRERAEASRVMAAAGRTIRFRPLVSSEPASVCAEVRRYQPGTVVVPAGLLAAQPPMISAFLEAVSGAVLIVR